jgi:hypothetical protein
LGLKEPVRQGSLAGSELDAIKPGTSGESSGALNVVDHGVDFDFVSPLMLRALSQEHDCESTGFMDPIADPLPPIAARNVFWGCINNDQPASACSSPVVSDVETRLGA